MQPYINIIGFIANHIDTASTNTTGYKNTCLQENTMTSFVPRCVFLLPCAFLVTCIPCSPAISCQHLYTSSVCNYKPLSSPVGPCHRLYRPLLSPLKSIPFCSNVKVSQSKNTAKNICTSLSRDVCFLLLHIV